MSISEYPAPTAGSGLERITTGPDGALWFTEKSSNQIGRITTAGVITEYTIPTGGSSPVGITTGPDGALWFTEVSGNKVARITTSGVVTEYPVPTPSSSPLGITTGPDKALWFTEESGNKIGRITTAGVITEYPVPTTSLNSGITTGPDGALWFTENAGNSIGRITTAGVITEFPVPTAFSNPGGITSGPDGALWFVENTGNGIGRITTAGVVTQYRVPTLSSTPAGITAGPDGALWFTEYAGNKIGRVAPVGYTCTNTTPPIIKSITSASSYGAYSYFASGSWLEIRGTNLADPNDPRLSAATSPGQWISADFNGSNAPTSLDGVSVSINAKPAYVWYLSVGQINVQAPEDMATGNVAITVTNCHATSLPFQLTRQALAPGLLAPSNFSIGGTQYVVATFASDGAYVLNTSTGASLGLNSRPAKPGDLIVAYGIGFGDVTPSILPGVVVGQNNTLVNSVMISFGSTNASLSYSGLAGSFVGLYEFYITVPSGLANGDYQINVTQNGTALPQTMYMTVHN